MTLRIRGQKNKQGDDLDLQQFDIERRDRFIENLPPDAFVLISYKKVGKPGSELQKKDALRKYYFSQIADKVGFELGHSGEYFHNLMKNELTSGIDEVTQLRVTKSVFSDKSTMENTERLEFINNVKALVWDRMFENFNFEPPPFDM